MNLRVLQIGNGVPPHSTENELRKAWVANGHAVTFVQENEPRAFLRAAEMVPDHDLVAWTKTDWDPPVPHVEMRALLDAARRHGIPTVSQHLDIWFGLHRESQVAEHPFFRSDLVCTADGGHDDRFAALGITHVWMPPGVGEEECQPGQIRPQYESDVAFVGSWTGYHREHRHRYELVAHLQRQWAGQVEFWPRRGEHAVRGPALRDLYRSVKVLVGDSAFAGSLPNYWSDRIPETLGRGGFLIHPYVPGLETQYTDGVHLRCWQAGDWDELDRLIAYYLEHDDERRMIASQGRAHVLAHNTYGNRIREVLAVLRDRGMLPKYEAA